MHYGEKYLHHYCADRTRVNGSTSTTGRSWPTPPFCKPSSPKWRPGLPISGHEDLKNVVSSGNERAPTPGETAPTSNSWRPKPRQDRRSPTQSARPQLRAMIGTHDGLEGALTLTEVTGSESLDKTAFIAMLTPARSPCAKKRRHR